MSDKKPAEQAKAEPQRPNLPTVAFHYIKSPQFRVIHVDGAYGGVSPRLLIHMALYSERFPIPQKAVHEVQPDGSVTEPPAETMGKEGVVREVEVEAMLDAPTAKALVVWLQDKLNTLDTIRGQLTETK